MHTVFLPGKFSGTNYAHMTPPNLRIGMRAVEILIPDLVAIKIQFIHRLAPSESGIAADDAIGAALQALQTSGLRVRASGNRGVVREFLPINRALLRLYQGAGIRAVTTSLFPAGLSGA